MDLDTKHLSFDPNIYSKDALIKASYDLSNRAIFLIDSRDTGFVVSIEPRDPASDLRLICNEFKTAIIDHQLRLQIGQKTQVIKEALIKAALREAGVE